MDTLTQGDLFGEAAAPTGPRFTKKSARVFLDGRPDDCRREARAYSEKGGTQEQMLRKLERIEDPDVQANIDTIRANVKKSWAALARYEKGGDMRHGAEDYAMLSGKQQM